MGSNLFLSLLISGLLAGLPIGSTASEQQPGTDAAVSDSLYNAHHPRLLFTRSEIPTLQEKVRDGGYDDDAYRFIRSLVDTVYSVQSIPDILGPVSFGVGDVPNLGVAAHLSIPPDTAMSNLGRNMTLYLAENYDPDGDTFYSPLRLRALSLGYDMFFEERPETERALVRDEIVAYIDAMMTVFDYELWLHQPYVSNKSAMVGASLGLAAICLADEIDTAKTAAALERADLFVETWLRCHLDPDGAYNEDAMYAGWSLRNLIPYFVARKRYDGYNYAERPGIKSMEQWIAFATLPDGGGKVNNINDAAYLNYPLSRHQTYFEWAQTEWQSGLAAWLWEHLVGTEYGHDAGRLADKSATVLWNQNLSPMQPGLVLPKHMLWTHRGLYYFRTGWQDGSSSDDVVFSFYSGKFQGGHAHEDQNNFTLYGYGAKFAIDHGYGWWSKQSEAHNMPFIDGKGQHNAGGSIGTDGRISEHLLGGYADYLLGDATSAYSTYSEFNRAGFPFPENDWSWGYDGGNPVTLAQRRVIVVHDRQTPPYFIIVDDIEKDDTLRTYEWRMHTLEDNTVDITANPIRISGGTGHLDLYALNPSFDSLVTQLKPFDNREIDPNSTIVSLSQERTAANFAVMMIPGSSSTAHPELLRDEAPWGIPAVVRWPGGVEDIFLLNLSGDNVSYSIPVGDFDPGRAASPTRTEFQGSTRAQVETDADLAHIRVANNRIVGYLLSNVSRFVYGGTPFVDIPEGTVNASLSAAAIHIDRDDIDFVFYAPGVNEVFYREQSLAVIREDGYIRRDWSRNGTGPPRNPSYLQVRTYPNPFNEAARVYVELGGEAPVTLSVYDIKGREVRKIWDDVLPRGGNILKWDGRTNEGHRAATGVYFLRTQIPGVVLTNKLVLLR